MGTESNAVKFLFAARAADVSFHNNVTLGRQNLFPNARELQDLFRLFKIEEDAEGFLSESRGYAEVDEQALLNAGNVLPA